MSEAVRLSGVVNVCGVASVAIGHILTALKCARSGIAKVGILGGTTMLKIVALAVAIVTTVTPALTEEQINTVSDETLSIGDWGKVLNQAVFACRLPGDL